LSPRRSAQRALQQLLCVCVVLCGASEAMGAEQSAPEELPHRPGRAFVTAGDDSSANNLLSFLEQRHAAGYPSKSYVPPSRSNVATLGDRSRQFAKPTVLHSTPTASDRTETTSPSIDGDKAPDVFSRAHARSLFEDRVKGIQQAVDSSTPSSSQPGQGWQGKRWSSVNTGKDPYKMGRYDLVRTQLLGEDVKKADVASGHSIYRGIDAELAEMAALEA